jgi:hypothetical protein
MYDLRMMIDYRMSKLGHNTVEGAEVADVADVMDVRYAYPCFRSRLRSPSSHILITGQTKASASINVDR